MANISEIMHNTIKKC